MLLPLLPLLRLRLLRMRNSCHPSYCFCGTVETQRKGDIFKQDGSGIYCVGEESCLCVRCSSVQVSEAPRALAASKKLEMKRREESQQNGHQQTSNPNATPVVVQDASRNNGEIMKKKNKHTKHVFQ